MRIEDHAGFFGLTSLGVIAIHADWPMYPEEHGADLALLWLTAFPQGTRFRRIDDIDRCSLFMADVKSSNQKDPFDQRNLHVAVWHADLLELRTRGFVEGVSAVSQRRWEELKRVALTPGPLFTVLPDGTRKEFQWPPLAEYEDDDVTWPEFSTDGLVVTGSGRSKMASLLADLSDDTAILGVRVQRLLELGFFDTAVREACVGLEHHLRNWLGSDRWGDSLVRQFVSRLEAQGGQINTQMRVLQAQLRMAFKLIRNDFMHKLVEADEIQCRAVLYRMALVRTVVEQIASGA